MSEFNITVDGGSSVRLPVAGKYCDRDIVITSEGGSAPADPVIHALEITKNGTYTTTDGVDGYSPVTVNVPIPDGYIIPEGVLEITENGIHDVAEYASVNVKVPTGGDDRLPEGYTKVDYIQFSGEQIVDTKLICNQDTKIVVIHTRDSGDSQYLYGVSSSDNAASVTAYLANGGSWRFGNKAISRQIATNPDILRTAVVTKSGITHETGTNSISGTGAFETNGTLLIGTCRSANGSIPSAQFDGKVLLFEVYQSNNLVLKYIPAFDADGVLGFYETVKGEFHTSITDVPFSGGYL